VTDSRNSIYRESPGWIAGLEICSVVFLITAFLWQIWRWIPVPYSKEVLQVLLPGLAGTIVVISFIRMRDNVRTLGLEKSRLGKGWGSLTVFSLVSLAALFIGGFALGDPSIELATLGWASKYILGLLAQQVALQAFLNNRVYVMFGAMKDGPRLWLTIIVGTVLFALLHMPNLWLTITVLPACVFWMYHFRKFGNLPALMASHLVLGFAAMILLGKGHLLNLRVGWPAIRKMIQYGWI